MHCVRRPLSRAAFTAGSNNPIKMPMMAMTTNNSTRVKPFLPTLRIDMGRSPYPRVFNRSDQT